MSPTPAQSAFAAAKNYCPWCVRVMIKAWGCGKVSVPYADTTQVPVYQGDEPCARDSIAQCPLLTSAERCEVLAVVYAATFRVVKEDGKQDG